MKPILAIEIDEILRAKWLQFDRYYTEEFDEQNEAIYTMDFRKNYKWDDMEEVINYLNEELPENISPMEYQVDDKGEAPVDHMAFKPKKEQLSADDVYKKFMYQDYLFEIHGGAPKMYKEIDLHFNQFIKKYQDYVNIVIFSEENILTIPPTLFFLSKVMSRVKTYYFLDEATEILDKANFVITTNPKILEKVQKGNQVIKLKRPYNEKLKANIEETNLVDLINHKEFYKLIGHDYVESIEEETNSEDKNNDKE
ncbi:MAG: hypothetical protein ACOCVF_01805 [bacterium]